MICADCKSAGETLYTGKYIATAHHQKCIDRHGISSTWCDCQHSVSIDELNHTLIRELNRQEEIKNG